MCTYSIVDYTVVDKFLYSICGSPFPEVLSLYNADSRHLISGGHPVQCTASYLCIVQTADIWSLGGHPVQPGLISLYCADSRHLVSGGYPVQPGLISLYCADGRHLVAGGHHVQPGLISLYCADSRHPVSGGHSVQPGLIE